MLISGVLKENSWSCEVNPNNNLGSDVIVSFRTLDTTIQLVMSESQLLSIGEILQNYPLRRKEAETKKLKEQAEKLGFDIQPLDKPKS